MIDELWPTPVRVGVIGKTSISATLDWARLRRSDLDHSASYQQIAGFLSGLTRRTDGGYHEYTITSSKMETLTSSDFRGIQYLGGEWAHIWISCLSDDDAKLAGHVLLHDPRAGAALVAMPGMPWGGAMAVPIQDGLSLIFPGWLGWSIPVVRTPHPCLLACVSVNRTSHDELDEGNIAGTLAKEASVHG